MTNFLKEIVSIRHYNMMDETHIMNDVKEAVCYVSQDFKGDLERTWKGRRGERRKGATEGAKDIVIDYVLPDPDKHNAGYARPHDPSLAAKVKKLGGIVAPGEGVEDYMTLGNERFTVPELLFNPGDVGMKQAGLHEVILQSMSAVPTGLWPAMLANIVVVGGNANIEGLVERLETELRPITPAECVVRVRKPEDPVKATWTGGTRLASNESALRELAVTKQEYQEQGASWLARRFANGAGGLR